MSMGVERKVRVGTDFGDALRERRLVAGLSEVRLATLAGVRVSEVRVWETGGAIPSPAVVRVLARALRLDSTTASQWLTWAGAEPVATVEVSILLLPGDAPADPFGDPAVVVDLNERRTLRAVPPPAIRLPRPVDRAPVTHPAITDRALRPRRPVDAPAVRPLHAAPIAAVFPEPRTDTFVYSDTGAEPLVLMRRRNRRRHLVMAIALVGLGVMLWWAFGQLGDGFASVVDRLGSGIVFPVG